MLVKQESKRLKNCYLKLNQVSGTLQRMIYHQPWIAKSTQDEKLFISDIQKVIADCEDSKMLIEYIIEEEGDGADNCVIKTIEDKEDQKILKEEMNELVELERKGVDLNAK